MQLYGELPEKRVSSPSRGRSACGRRLLRRRGKLLDHARQYALGELVPGVGDAVTTLLSLYMVLEARRLGVPLTKLGRMGLNVGVDAALGAVPVLGDLFDVAWKANRRNLALLLDHVDAERQTRHAARREPLIDSDQVARGREI